MNTLKMKVLLFLTNAHLFRSIRRAVIVWILACVTGCVTLFLLDFFFLSGVEDLLPAVVLSLIFSTPALVVAVVVFYYLHLLPGLFVRIISSTATMLTISAVIVGIVSVYFNQAYIEVAKTLYPFVLSAFVYFFLIARKQLVVSYPL